MKTVVLPITHLPSNPSPVMRPLLGQQSLSLPACCPVDDVTTEAARAPRPWRRAGRWPWPVGYSGETPPCPSPSPSLLLTHSYETTACWIFCWGCQLKERRKKKYQACLKRGRSLVGEMVTCEVKRSKMLKQASKEEHQGEMLTNGRRLWCSLRKWGGAVLNTIF